MKYIQTPVNNLLVRKNYLKIAGEGIVIFLILSSLIFLISLL